MREWAGVRAFVLSSLPERNQTQSEVEFPNACWIQPASNGIIAAMRIQELNHVALHVA
jgi:hypothetical protein